MPTARRPSPGPETLLGIGAVSGQQLRDAGVTTAQQVRRLGAVACYRRICEHAGHRQSLNLLWALQGGIEDIHWTMVPPKQREQLKEELKAASTHHETK